MRKSRFTETQIIGMINEQEAGLAVVEVCRKHGISPASFYKLKAKYGGIAHSDVSGRSFRQHLVSHSGVSGHLRIVAA